MDDRKSLLIVFLVISDQYATFNFGILFTKWPPAAILDDRKSLSIAFLVISDQYATFFKHYFTKWPAAILDDRKSRSIAFFGMSDQYATLFIKMGASHFGSRFEIFEIDRILLLYVING